MSVYLHTRYFNSDVIHCSSERKLVQAHAAVNLSTAALIFPRDLQRRCSEEERESERERDRVMYVRDGLITPFSEERHKYIGASFRRDASYYRLKLLFSFFSFTRLASIFNPTKTSHLSYLQEDLCYHTIPLAR